MAAILAMILFAGLVAWLWLMEMQNITPLVSAVRPSTAASQESLEMQQFFQASVRFLNGFNAPANGEFIQVTDLQKAGLLPATFPMETPFGQVLEGWPVESPANPNITNLVVLISGTPSSSDLQEAGLPNWTPGSNPNSLSSFNTQVRYDLSEVENTPTPQTQAILAGTVRDQGQELGWFSLQNLMTTANLDIPASALGAGVDSSPALEAIAPNQLGYTLISYSVTGDNLPWGIYVPFNVNTGTGQMSTEQVEGAAFWTQIQSTSVSVLGWSPTCPSSATLLQPGMNTVSAQESDINTASNIGGGGEFCFHSYRAEAVNKVQTWTNTITDAYQAISVGAPIYQLAEGSLPTNSGGIAQLDQPSNDQSYNSPPAAAGLTYTVNGTEYSTPWGMPAVDADLVPTVDRYGSFAVHINGATYYGYQPQNNFWQETIPVGNTMIPLNIVVLQPDGTGTTVETYQILFDAYQLPTGTGGTWADLNLPTPEESDPDSGFDGFSWPGGPYSLYDGEACPFTSDLDNNVMATDCSGEQPLGTANITDAWVIQVNALAGNQTAGGTVTQDYISNPGSGAQSVPFSITVPSNLMQQVP